jgi:hypothetical protein
VVPGKVVVGGAHPNGGSMVWCDRGGSTVTSEAMEALRGWAAVARATEVGWTGRQRLRILVALVML